MLEFLNQLIRDKTWFSAHGFDHSGQSEAKIVEYSYGVGVLDDWVAENLKYCSHSKHAHVDVDSQLDDN